MFMHPVPGPITSPYGPRRIGFHNGIDYGWLLADPVNSRNIYAPATGTVRVGWNALVGNFIELPTELGVLRLAHFASIAVKTGDTVTQGRTLLGVMGQTGLQAQGVHLHVDLFMKDGRVDPQPHFTIPFKVVTTPEPEEEDEMQPQNFVDASTRNAKGEHINGTVCMTVWPSGGVQVYKRVIPAPAGQVEFAVQMFNLYGAHRPVGHEVFESIRDANLATHGGSGGGGFTVEDRTRLNAVPTAEQNGAAARTAIVK